MLLADNYKRISKQMEAKATLILLKTFGISMYISDILLNIGTWKADFLFGIGVLWGLSQLIFAIVRGIQDVKKRGKDLNK